MEWLGSNWIWLALGLGALAFFAFGRGGCGMSHGGRQSDDRSRESTTGPLSRGTGGALADVRAGHDGASSQPRRHRHGC
jgi:hypothetical protein